VWRGCAEEADEGSDNPFPLRSTQLLDVVHNELLEARRADPGQGVILCRVCLSKRHESLLVL
jgi:hypothetical protein